jgi:hypothetical protein
MDINAMAFSDTLGASCKRKFVYFDYEHKRKTYRQDITY